MEAVVERFASTIAESLVSCLEPRRVLSVAAEQLGIALEADRVVILLQPALAKAFSNNHPKKPLTAMEWSRGLADPAREDEVLEVSNKIQEAILPAAEPLCINHLGSDKLLSSLQKTFEHLDILRILACSARADGFSQATVLAYRGASSSEWFPDETHFLQYVSHYLGIALRNCLTTLTSRDTSIGSVSKSGSYAISFDESGNLCSLTPLIEQVIGAKESQLLGWPTQQFFKTFFSGDDIRAAQEAYKSVTSRRSTPTKTSTSSNTASPPLVLALRHSKREERFRVAAQFLHSSETGITNLLLLPLPSEFQRDKDSEKLSLARDSWYRRLVEHADAIIFYINTDHIIKFMGERSTEFFGIPSQDFSAGTPVRWYDLAHLDDREQLKRTALDAQAATSAFEEEFRIVNHLSGRERWLLAKFVPVEDTNGAFEGWDGFAVDITARREAQEALDSQSKKVRALYTVSSAIRGYLDPANIASRGLAALCEATGADAGICYLYPGKDSDRLSLVAHHGFSAQFAEKVESYSTLPSLSTYVAEHGQAVVVPDIRTDPRSSLVLAEEEGVRSAVLVPISVEEETLGTLALFHQQISKFDGGDVMLVAAAANQIGLASRQANLFSAYRRQTKNLSALYRLSHELSGFLTLDDIFQRAFAIISDELELQRLWLGLVNETGTRIVGTAAYGPGWKKRLVEMNVEISGREHPISQVVTSRKGMLIEDPDEALNRFGVKRLFSRLDFNAVGLVPLVSGGQVLGVLAFQVEGPEAELDDEQMTLISSLGSEIAAIVLTKRLEERIAQGEKMRAAGLLAAGIAHNFNNLLQAILGQASLLEMQFPEDEKVGKPAKTINQAATKGAALVKQLVSFANLEEPIAELCDINDVLERGRQTISRHLKDRQRLELDLHAKLPRAFVDPGQLMRILSTLVSNAADAMGQDGKVEIFSDLVSVDKNSPHYEVPYGKYLRIGVRDSGSGMDSETKRRCFDPFFTTKDRDPNSGLSLSGAGLSLAAAYALARKNGGRLAVDSRVGHGSLFTLYLPIVSSEKELETKTDLNEKEDEEKNSSERKIHELPLNKKIEKARDLPASIDAYHEKISRDKHQKPMKKNGGIADHLKK